MNINVYLEDDLHEAVAKHAAKHNVSKNSVIRDAIREMVMDDAPYSMKEGQSSFSHSEPIEDFSQFAECKNLKESFEKMESSSPRRRGSK